MRQTFKGAEWYSAITGLSILTESKVHIKNYNIVSVNKNEEDTEENQVDDGEEENKNKSQYLFYQNFKFFLKVLRDYYFLCMVERS